MGRLQAGLIVLACLGLAAAGCSSSAASSDNPGGNGGSGKSGTANVAYAASLSYLNDQVFGPAFEKATGYTYQGTAGPSDGLSAEIASKTIFPNVFITVGGKSIESLGAKFTKWYVQYATTSIVLAYNPNSKYAPQFEAIAKGQKPISDLFKLMEQPGFQLGRTDPNTDPQGRAFIYMLELAQMKYNLPKDTVTKILGGPLSSAKSTQIFEEVALDSRLQAGQVDAASAYLSQAKQLHLHYISLPPEINLGDASFADNYAKASITITDSNGKEAKTGSPLTIDITTIRGAKDPAAANAFVAYVLSPAGRSLYQKQGGYTLLKPTLTGPASAVPASIRKEIGS
ncbi:MAG: substrate-binding domain-containing protein [Nocardiopsaceae bacterium]|nr:substrate-binding domain-containing protein [Nocardiopsaceae bacterium]